MEYLAVNLSRYKKVGSGVTAFIVKMRICVSAINLVK